jgi:hypothetical protein
LERENFSPLILEVFFSRPGHGYDGGRDLRISERDERGENTKFERDDICSEIGL